MKLHKRNTPAVTIAVQVASSHTALPPTAALKRWCAATLHQQKVRRAGLCIRLVDGRESAALNKRYRHKPGATNVLSFPAGMANTDELGDIVICAPVVAREARAQGKAVAAHWAHLVVHGTLHLLGHDHIKKQDAARMEALEVKILAHLGFDNPYN